MAETLAVTGTTKSGKYQSLLPQIAALVEGESNYIANLANITAALKFGMDFFWVGFYFVDKSSETLVLGPFQGPVACTRIPFGKGVCGTSWKKKETVIVEDVDLFPGHIACSSLSKSEIVLPAFDDSGNVILVLDIDSESKGTFDDTDRLYLEELMRLIEKLSSKK